MKVLEFTEIVEICLKRGWSIRVSPDSHDNVGLVCSRFMEGGEMQSIGVAGSSDGLYSRIFSGPLAEASTRLFQDLMRYGWLEDGASVRVTK